MVAGDESRSAGRARRQVLTTVVSPLGVFHSRLTSLLVSLLDSLMDQDSSLYDIIHVIICFPLASI